MSRSSEREREGEDGVQALLRATADSATYPPTPRLAARVRARLERQTSRSRAARLVSWSSAFGRIGPLASNYGWSRRAAIGGLVAASLLVGSVVVYQAVLPVTPSGLLRSPLAERPAAAPMRSAESADSGPPSARAGAPPTAPARDAAAAVAGAAQQSSGRTAANLPTDRQGAGEGMVVAPAAPGSSTGAFSGTVAPVAPPPAPDTRPTAERVAPLPFTPLAPSSLGRPDRVEPANGGAGVRLLYGARPGLPAPPPGRWLVRLTEAPASASAPPVGPGQRLTWPGGEGLWTPAPDGGGTLEWTQGPLALRLETPLTDAQAAAIAASLAPLNEP